MNNPGYIKHLKQGARRDENKFLNWYELFMAYCFEKDGKDTEIGKYNPEFIREYYSQGLTPEQAYRECKSDLLIEEEEED
jgi:hypothetical protein